MRTSPTSGFRAHFFEKFWRALSRSVSRRVFTSEVGKTKFAEKIIIGKYLKEMYVFHTVIQPLAASVIKQKLISSDQEAEVG